MDITCPSIATLRFIRDNHPTEPQLLEFLGGEFDWKALADYSTVCKSVMVVLREGKWSIHSESISTDGKILRWNHKKAGTITMWLDEDRGQVDLYFTDGTI